MQHPAAYTLLAQAAEAEDRQREGERDDDQDCGEGYVVHPAIVRHTRSSDPAT